MKPQDVEEMAMCKIRDVSELYALADKCARAEEGRKLHGEEDCTNIDSEDDDEYQPVRRRARSAARSRRIRQ